jgi:hypothetical protein
MFITRKHLSRRTVLRGVGAAISLPLLDAMVPAATALANTAAKPMPRIGFIFFAHGAVANQWVPTTTGSDFKLPPILAPLEKYRSQMTVISGTRNKAADSKSPHAIKAGTWLGCVAPTMSQLPQAGITADQIAAQHIGQDTTFPSLELCTEGGTGAVCDPHYGCSYGNTVSFRTPNQPLPMEFNPRTTFYRLFGQGDTAAERDSIVRETGSTIDRVKDDATALGRKLGPSDRALVGNYLESVREVERRVQQLKEKDFSGLKLPEAPVGVPNDFNEHMNIMFELLALAYQTNLTRVATFMMSREVSMRTHNNVGVPDAFHPLSHHQEDPTKMERLAKVQAYYSTVFARFLDRLAATPDGDGSLLDHSVLLYGSNMGNSNRHESDKLPSALFGGCCGRIKGGQHLAYPQDTPHANTLLTMLNRAGVPVEKLGDSTGQFAEI